MREGDTLPIFQRIKNSDGIKPPKKYLFEDVCLECGTRIYIAQDTTNNMWRGYHQKCWECDAKRFRGEKEELLSKIRYLQSAIADYHVEQL